MSLLSVSATVIDTHLQWYHCGHRVHWTQSPFDSPPHKEKRESTLILILSLLFLTSHIMKILSSLQLKNLQAMTIKNVLLLCFISLFHFKDVIPKELQSHLVYKFTCGNCNLTYYGKTKRHLNARSSEHKCISHFINIVATIVWIATHSHITSFQVLQKVQTSICYKPNAYH